MNEGVKPTAAIYSQSEEHGGSLSVVVNGEQKTIRSENPLFDQAVEAYKAGDWTLLYDLMEPAKAVSRHTMEYEDITVSDGAVFYKGEEVHGVIVQRILDMLEDGFDVLPLVKFLQKLMANPSRRAVTELYSFLAHKNLPITPEGNFVAYKSVKSDLTDWHSGTFNNSVGNTLEMPRNKVDDDKDRHCSYGFHAGTFDYASTFGGSDRVIVLVEIDPGDVVSIPSDCNCQKLRTCKYIVIDKMKNPAPLERAVYSGSESQETYGDDGETWGGEDEDEEY